MRAIAGWLYAIDGTTATTKTRGVNRHHGVIMTVRQKSADSCIGSDVCKRYGEAGLGRPVAASAMDY
jgi:hypothetical protein